MEVIVTLVCQHESCLKAFRLPNHRRIWIKLNDRGRILGRKAKAARLGMARMRGAFHENGWWWNRRCEFRAMNRIMFGSISLSRTMRMLRKAGPRMFSVCVAALGRRAEPLPPPLAGDASALAVWGPWGCRPLPTHARPGWPSRRGARCACGAEDPPFLVPRRDCASASVHRERVNDRRAAPLHIMPLIVI